MGSLNIISLTKQLGTFRCLGFSRFFSEYAYGLYSFRYGFVAACLALSTFAAMHSGCGAPPPNAAATVAPSATPPKAISPQKGDYNVLVIVSDALRADHLGAYGYARATSPFIDQLGREGVVFERAVSCSSFTGESVSALFMGRWPSATPWSTGWYARPDPSVKTLAKRFQEMGYATGLITDTPMLIPKGFHAGFDESHCLAEKYGISGLGPKITETALEFLRARRGGKNFLYLHYLDPHGPYDPPEAYYRRFSEQKFPHPLELTEQVRNHLPALAKEGFGPGEARFEDLVLRYDAEIAMIDDCIKTLAAGLRDLGIQDRTIIVFTSDHGEEFLDHGFVEHAWRLYWESVHVPLVFWAPGLLPPGRIGTAVSLADILPTLFTLLQSGQDLEGVNGEPLFHWQEGRWAFGRSSNPILSELRIATRNVGRSIISGQSQYLMWQQWATWQECSELAQTQKQLRDDLIEGKRAPAPVCGPAIHEEFFDLRADPREQHNLIQQESERAAALRAPLEEYCVQWPEPIPDAYKVNGATGGLTEEQLRQLEAIGYIGGLEKSDAQPGEGESSTGEKESSPIEPKTVTPSESEREQLKNLGYL